jgi:cell division protein FtsB
MRLQEKMLLKWIRKEQKMCRKMWLGVTVGILMLFCICGCEMLKRQADDPNSPLSGAVDTMGKVGQGMSETGAAAGVGTVMTGAAGVYKVRQKNKTIDGQDAQYKMIKATTESIVDAIEDVGEVELPGDIGGTAKTVGDLVKGYVNLELERHRATVFGKAVIDGLKPQKISK